jgi:Flp pilus assembly protein TadD/ADP-heptose:LPS heptosyltransferase
MTFPSLDTGNQSLQRSLALLGRAGTLRQEGDVVGAVAAYQQAIRANSMNGVAYFELLAMLLQLGEVANAEKVLAAVPPSLYGKSSSLQRMQGIVLMEQGRYADAISLIQRLQGDAAINQANLSNDLGSCYSRQEKFDEALAHYRRAFQAGMRDPVLYTNIAGIYSKQGNSVEAEKYYREALHKYPGHADVTYEYANFMLKTEQFERGFPLYRRRWEAAQFGCTAPLLPIPEWDGKTRVRSLLVLGEQGVGEHIVFSSLLRGLAAKADKIAIAFDRRLNPLFTRSFPEIGIANASGNPSEAELVEKYDAYTSAADMGALVPDAIGWKHGYLKADPERAARLRHKYQAMFPGKKLVGISWKSTRPLYGEKKTVDIEAWKNVLATESCQFICLQYGDVQADLERAASFCASGHGVYLDPEIDSFNDLDGLATQIASLDLVITTSNSTAHLAAAIDAPTWLLLPTGSGLCWYWGQRKDSVAWYPHIRPFRIKEAGNWAPALHDVMLSLQKTCEVDP